MAASDVVIVVRTIIEILAILGIAVVGLILYFRKQKRRCPFGACEVINLNTDFTEGHFILLEKKIIPLNNERLYITLVPVDFEDVEEGEEKPILKEYSVVVPYSKRTESVRGSLSSFKNVVIYEPTDINKLPRELKDSSIGVFLENKFKYTEFTERYQQASKDTQEQVKAILMNVQKMPMDLLVKRVDEIFDAHWKTVSDKKKEGGGAPPSRSVYG